MYLLSNEQNELVAFPYDYRLLKKDNPRVLFPLELSVAQMAEFYMYPVTELPAPVINDKTQFVIRNEAPLLVDGNWQFGWTVIEKSSETLVAEFEDLKEQIKSAVAARLDAFAQTREYDSALSCCSYVNDTVLAFKADAEYMIQVRGATWEILVQILADVIAETRVAPNSYEDIEAELPVLAWPT